MNNENDYLPFLDYFLGVVLKDYRDFNERLSHINQTDLPVDKLILKAIRQALQPLSIKQLNEHIPQYSEITIHRVLKKFREEEKIIMNPELLLRVNQSLRTTTKQID